MIHIAAAWLLVMMGPNGAITLGGFENYTQCQQAVIQLSYDTMFMNQQPVVMCILNPDTHRHDVPR